MAITFDHVNQRIVLTSPTTSVTMQELINAIRTEEASERGITYPSIATASGKDALGGGVYVAITVNLKDPWQVEPYAGAYTLSIGEGNLVSSRADGDVTYYISGGPQIEIRSSAAGTISVVSSGSGLSAEQDTTLTAINTKLGIPIATVSTDIASVKADTEKNLYLKKLGSGDMTSVKI